MSKRSPQDIVLIGGGAHAFSLWSMLKQDKRKYRILGYTDTEKTSLAAEYLGTDEGFIKSKKYNKKQILLVMCIGVNTFLRKKLFNFFKKKGYNFLTYIHPAAVEVLNAECGEGSIVFPGVVLGPFVKLGDNVCIHSNVTVEHRTFIGSHSYVSLGTSIAGDCHIDRMSFVGINAGISNSVFLQENTVVGAGAIVLKSFLKKNITLIGTPARILRKRKC